MNSIDTKALILDLLNNKNPPLEKLCTAIRQSNITIIHDVVAEFTNLRAFSDRPLLPEQLEQFAQITECIFQVYINYSNVLLQQKQENQDMTTSDWTTQSIINKEPQQITNAVQPLWSDMNVLLNSLRTYFVQEPARKRYASERFRGHQLFTFHTFWRGVFQQALHETSIDEEDANSAFVTINAQIVVHIHLMRAFGLVEEDVRLWLQYFLNISGKKYSQLKNQQISMFYEQIESVFSSADEEEKELPLEIRNNIVRVLPNYSGYKCVYVNVERLNSIDFKEEPLFNCEQEQLLKEITTLMSEPVELKKLSKQQQTHEDLTRNQVIQKLWREQTDLPLFEDVVAISKCSCLADQIEEYLEAVFDDDLNMKKQQDEQNQLEWDEESTTALSPISGNISNNSDNFHSGRLAESHTIQ